MKYTIEGYSQEKLIQSNLDCVDAVILRWYSDFQSSGKMLSQEVKGKVFYWLKYQYLLDEIPIIKITNRRALATRMRKYIASNIVEKAILRNIDGTFTLYRLSDAYYDLVSQGGVHNKMQGDALENAKGLHNKMQPKDSSINDPSIKYIYDFWISRGITKHKRLDSRMSRAIKRALKDYSKDELIQCIHNYALVYRSEVHYYSHKWRLEDFMQRGFHKFLDESDPVNNFRNREKKDWRDKKDDMVRRFLNGEETEASDSAIAGKPPNRLQ